MKKFIQFFISKFTLSFSKTKLIESELVVK